MYSYYFVKVVSFGNSRTRERLCCKGKGRSKALCASLGSSMTEDTPVEYVDVVKEDQIQLAESHRQPPSEQHRYSPSQSHHPSVLPTECTSGVSFVDGAKVEELAKNLLLATQENERYRLAMEDCNKVLSKEVEAAETRQKEAEQLRNQLDMYKETNKVLEDHIRDMENQQLNTVCWCVCV